MFFNNNLSIINQHYITLCTTVFVGQKWSNEFPEQLTCNKIFLDKRVKEILTLTAPGGKLGGAHCAQPTAALVGFLTAVF